MRFIINWLRKLHIIHDWDSCTSILIMPKKGLLLCEPIEPQTPTNDASPFELYNIKGVRPAIIKIKKCKNLKCNKVQTIRRMDIDVIAVPVDDSIKHDEVMNHVQTSQSLH